jgi:hypothetical protein
MKKLASLIASREGKKSQARIGDIREILRVYKNIEARVRAGRATPEEVDATSAFDVEIIRRTEVVAKLR